MKNILTVDLEDWYHICGLPEAIRQEDWPSLEARVSGNTEKLLSIFSRHKAKATFFVLGYIAERNRGLIKRISAEGHEIASHGFGHKLLTDMSESEFRQDLLLSKEAIKSVTGVYPKGFRAPSFSITPVTKWAFGILADYGFKYDSSVFPVRRADGGFKGMPFGISDIDIDATRKIREFPISIANFMGVKIPFSGGGYLRFLPYFAIKYFFDYANRSNNPVIVYIHPRDIDPGQPRLKMPVLKSIKTYSGLNSCENKLNRLLRDFEFGPIEELL